MTLAKTCHASNMMQDLEKSNLLAYCNHESFLNSDVSMFHRCLQKIESRLET